MTLRFAATAALLLIVPGCGSQNASAPAAETDLAQHQGSPGEGVELAGRLAPNLAPPAALVVLEPQGTAELPVKVEPAIMDQAGYEFLPAFLIAQAGQPVQFRNSEDVLHNVRVAEVSSQKPVFNVATLAFGKYEHTFEAGYYNVTCDIHTTMRASILVTASPYTATTAEDGTFSIANVLPGKYNLTVYAGPAPVVRPIEVKNSRTDLGVIQ
jgi:plastocyanin